MVVPSRAGPPSALWHTQRLSDVTRRMVDLIDVGTLKGLRDRALLLLESTRRFRRGDVVAIEAHLIQQSDAGLLVQIPRMATCVLNCTRVIGIQRFPDLRYCAVQAISDWLCMSGISSGYVFRRLYDVNVVSNTPLRVQGVVHITQALARRAKCELDWFSMTTCKSPAEERCMDATCASIP